MQRNSGLNFARGYDSISVGLERPYKPLTPSTLGGPTKLPKSYSVELEQRANLEKILTIFKSRTDEPLVGFPAGTKVPSCPKDVRSGNGGLNPGNAHGHVLSQAAPRSCPNSRPIGPCDRFTVRTQRQFWASQGGRDREWPACARMKKRVIERREPVRKSEYGAPVRSRPVEGDRRKKKR